jgi:peptidoglycan/xylan/chitin deacetylase (PgdA/CDA1 family)
MNRFQMIFERLARWASRWAVGASAVWPSPAGLALKGASLRGAGWVSFLGLVLTLGSSCQKPTLPKVEAEVAPAAAPVVEATPAPPPPPQVKTADTTGSVVVLCYHRFEPKPKDGLAITPADFEAQMQALKDNGFTVLGMGDFLAWRRGEKSIPAKSCVITIDDGYRSSYEVAWPILKKFEYPFTMFIYPAFVRGGALAGGASLSWEQLREMRDAGVDIQSHTMNHQNLRMKKGKFQSQFATWEEWLRFEIGESRRVLERQLGISVRALAYPYGNHNEEIRAVAMEAGYEAAFSVYGQRLSYHSPADQLGRYAVESTKPKIFTDAMAMIGGGPGESPRAAGSGAVGGAVPAGGGQLAAVSMVTVPMEGEVIRDSKPVIKANLATFGEVEPGSVEMRVSGVGPVPVKYDPATKLAQGTLLQPLKEKQVTVLLSAVVGGRRVETRWNFSYEPQGSGAPAPTGPVSGASSKAPKVAPPTGGSSPGSAPAVVPSVPPQGTNGERERALERPVPQERPPAGAGSGGTGPSGGPASAGGGGR